MYKVLLVDDERIFLEFMEKIIDWTDYNCVICGKAIDGHRAVEIIREQKPDIVFLDINMSRMSGLEVCEEIRELSFSPRIVIVTAHDEFQFAYKAIKLKVFDYLLKPFDEKELTATLEKCIHDIQKEEEFRKLQKHEDARRVEMYFKNAIELKAVNSTECPIDILPGARFIVAMIKYDVRNCKLPNEIKEIFIGMNDSYNIKSYPIDIYFGMLVVIHVIDDKRIQTGTIKQWYQDMFDKYGILECECISLGNFVNSIYELAESYHQAIISMENRTKFTDFIVSYDSIEKFNLLPTVYTDNDINMLIRCFEAGEYNKVDMIIKKIFGLFDNQLMSFQYILSVYNCLVIRIYSYFKHNYDINDLTNYLNTQSDLLQELNTCSNTQQVFEIIKNYIYEVFGDCIDYKNVTKKDVLVTKIDQYLEQHYMEPGLSVEQIAAELFYENSYLRRVYKIQTGKTIMQRLEDIRMNKAKQLLKDTQYKISEIADKVGFSDQFYFSKRFKLYCNLTPSQYRMMMYSSNYDFKKESHHEKYLVKIKN